MVYRCMYSKLRVLYVCYVCVFNEYRLQERDLSVIYMAFVALVFFIYSLYHSCTRIRPKLAEKRHDPDICGIESARRNCADATHRYHGNRRSQGVAVGVVTPLPRARNNIIFGPNLGR